ncbi:hypothetical protein SuNHUV7_30570 (plasmid) [Pseudoseohaeicola sp. NH-UV-7]|jgi:hypothetical protein|nr:hypothetical protein [Sulfitobacter sp. JL08]
MAQSTPPATPPEKGKPELQDTPASNTAPANPKDTAKTPPITDYASL